jgi:hypothetical protein
MISHIKHAPEPACSQHSASASGADTARGTTRSKAWRAHVTSSHHATRTRPCPRPSCTRSTRLSRSRRCCRTRQCRRRGRAATHTARSSGSVTGPPCAEERSITHAQHYTHKIRRQTQHLTVRRCVRDQKHDTRPTTAYSSDSPRAPAADNKTPAAARSRCDV